MNNEVLNQLPYYKKKSVNDLARYMRNRNDSDIPSYTMLIGAGCSITSGVKSARTIINDWKREISKSNNISFEKIDEYLQKQSWYDERYAYSCLFEKQYDQQSQRRAFIERIVSDKAPSIGYAYLVKLIENCYVNTVFTTNFDDLLNEAFYRFASNCIRPIVCAHDSAISSITVTSKRPKIIKLHGDYLFENIKNTTRETESLDVNMHNKFMEFAKDFGLVVIGYSGTDRSIMDILTQLVKNDEYFKNGIYWCVRKGDSISDELARLLWKDRVYTVEIDGFDELMAELNDQLNEGRLPIEGAMLSTLRQKELIKSLTANESIKKTSSSVIKRNIQELDVLIERNIEADFFSLNSRKNLEQRSYSPYYRDNPRYKRPIDMLDSEDKEKICCIKDLMFAKKWDDALGAIDEKLHITTSSDMKEELLLAKMECLQAKKNPKENAVLEVLKELIKIDPEREKYYVDACYYSKSFEDKVDFINKALDRYPKDFFLLNKKGSLYMEQSQTLELNEHLDEAIEIFLNSLKEKPSINNPAIRKLTELYQKKYYSNPGEMSSKISELVNKYKPQDSANASYNQLCLDYRKELNYSDEALGNLLKESYEKSKLSDSPVEWEKNTLTYASYLYEHEKEIVAGEIMKEYEKNYEPSSDYNSKKIEFILLETDADLENVIDKLEKEHYNYSDITNLIQLYAITKKSEKLEKFIEEYKNDDDIMMCYYHETKKYDIYINKVEDKYLKKNKPLQEDMLCSYLYACIKLKKWEGAYQIAKKYYDNPETFRGPIAINYYLLTRMRDPAVKIDDKIQKKILEKKDCIRNDVLACAYAMLGDKKNALDYIEKWLKHHRIYKYDMREWPAFESLYEDKRFKEIMGLNV